MRPNILKAQGALAGSERRSTTQKQPKPMGSITTYQRILELDPKQRRTSSDVRLKQIPTLQQQNQQKLDFSHNLIRKIENLEPMKRLKQLNLSHNRITRIENIFGLRRLQELNLAHNCIETLPKELSWLKGLTTLLLNNNKIAALEQLDSISCLRLTRLTLENNFVCKVAGFKKYVYIHFKWLELLDKRPVSHREVNNYETPLESLQEDHEDDLRTCERNTSGVFRDQTATHKREEPSISMVAISVASVSPSPKPTEVKPVKTQRLNKDTDIIPYREYLKRQKQEAQVKLLDNKPTNGLQLKTIATQYWKLRANDEKFVQNLQTGKSKVQAKLAEFIEKLDTLFEMMGDSQGSESPSSVGVQACNKLLKELNLINLQLLNLEAQNTSQVNGCREKIQQYADLYCRTHRAHLSRAPSAQLNWSSNMESPPRAQKEGLRLKKILFSNGYDSAVIRENQSEELQALHEQYNAQVQKTTLLKSQLSRLQSEHEALDRTRILEQEQHLQYEQLMEEQVAMITTERNAYRQRLETSDIFTEALRQLYQKLDLSQQEILGMMRAKLSGDFFQQIIVSQAKSIEQLLKTNGDIQKKCTVELKSDPLKSMENTIRGKQNSNCMSRTRNTRKTRYPDSTIVANSAESNLLECSEARKPELKHISEFTINPTDRESARFPDNFRIRQSVSFENLGNRTEYFRRSTGFSFKKSQKSLLSGSKSRVKHLVTDKNESDSKVKIDRPSGSRARRLTTQNDNPNGLSHQRSYFTENCRLQLLPQVQSSSYSEVPLEQADNYKNYLKYYLRNNIIEVLTKGEVHPHLRGRWSKEEVLHRKYHSVGSGGLIAKVQSSRK